MESISTALHSSIKSLANVGCFSLSLCITPKYGFKKYVQKLETKFRAESRYLTYIDYSVSFRRAMDLQINQFIRAIEEQDVQQYTPVMIR